MEILLRSTPTFNSTFTPRVDRIGKTIYGVVAMQAFVEALGHGVMSDMTTLRQFAEQGNAKTNGVRGRFGHPAISENATGKQVQLARNFRVEGTNLLHDSHLLESAAKSPAFSQDPTEFILDIAEKNPTEFGESVVASVDLFWILNDEGEQRELTEYEYHDVHFHGGVERPEDSIYDFPVMRLKEGGFRYVDFVNEGALTHSGLFEGSVTQVFKGKSSEFGHELFTLVDRWRETYGISLEELERKTGQIVKKYIHLRTGKDIDMSISDEAIARRRKTKGMGRQVLALEAQPDIDPTEEVVDDGDDSEEETQEELSTNDDTPTPEPVTPDTQELEDPAPQPVPAVAGTEISASLDAAEKAMLALAEKEKEAEESRDKFGALVGRIDDLSTRMDKLSADLIKASTLLANQAEWIAKLSNNVARIDGERVVTEQVPRFATNPHDKLEPIPTTPGEMLHPQPPLNQFSTRGIDGMPEELVLATDTPQTAAEKAIANQNRRQRAYRLQGSQSLPR